MGANRLGDRKVRRYSRLTGVEWESIICWYRSMHGRTHDHRHGVFHICDYGKKGQDPTVSEVRWQDPDDETLVHWSSCVYLDLFRLMAGEIR